MSASRDEIIRVLLQTGGTEDLRKLRDELDTVVGSSERAGKGQTSFAAALNKSKAALVGAAAGLAGVTAILRSGAQASSQFQTAIAEVGTLLQNQSGIPQLTEDVKAMAREFGGSAVDQAKALYQIISAGAQEGAEANAILTASNKLAIGGITDLKTAADGLTSVLNAYNLPATEAARVSDLFFTAVKDGKTTIGELSAALGQVAPLASEAGVGIDELLAGVAALTKTGASTSTAVTAIRGALTGIVKPTAEAANLAEELGLQFDVAALKSKGFAEFLDDVRTATGGNQAQLAKLFGSVEGLNGVLALTGSQAESFAASLDNMAASAGAAQRAFEQIDDTPAQRLARFQAAWEGVQISLGNVVTAFAPVLEVLATVLNAITQLPGPVQTVVVGLGALAGAALPLSVAFKTLGPILGSLAGSLPSIGAGASAASNGLGLLTKAARGLAVALAAGFAVDSVIDAQKAISDLVDINERVAQSERDLALIRDVQRGKIDQIKSAYDDLAKVQIKSNDEVERLAGYSLDTYVRQLNDAAKYWRAIEIEAKRAGSTQEQAFARDRASQFAAEVDRIRGRMRELAIAADQAEESLDSAFDTLGVSAEVAGKQITDSGQKVLDAFKSISESVKTTGVQVSASFTAALSKLSTSAEVRALGQSLLDAFVQGKIGAEEFQKQTDTAREKLRQLQQETGGLSGSMEGAAESAEQLADQVELTGDRGKAATKQLETGFVNVEKVANTADRAIAEMGKNAGGAAAGVREVLSGIEAGIVSLGAEAKAEFDALIRTMAGADGIIETSGLTMAQALQRVANVAILVTEKHTSAQEAAARHASAMEFLSQNADTAAAELARLGFTVDDIRNGTITASDAMRALGNQRMNRLRPELEGVASALQGIEDGARSAVSELANMNREYEKSRLQRAGNEKALAELELQEELRRIDELARAAGAAGAAEAAEARRRAQEEHRARLREIREREKAELDSVDNIDQRRRTSGSGVGIGSSRPTQQQTQQQTQPVRTVKYDFGNLGNVEVTENSAATLEAMLEQLRRSRRVGSPLR